MAAFAANIIKAQAQNSDPVRLLPGAMNAPIPANAVIEVGACQSGLEAKLISLQPERASFRALQ